MTLTLRPYQSAAIAALYAYWSAEPGNPLIVLPTGAGKSLVMASLMQDLIEGWPDMRLACVTHVKELISQNYSELINLWPWAPAGIYSAGLGRRETQAQILFCGIQSVRDRAGHIGHVDVLLVDEVHLIPRSADTSYGRFITGLREINPDMKIVGLTATPFRLDSGRLDEPDPRTGAPALFDKVAYEISIRDLMDQGYLAPLISKATATMLDVSAVHQRGGEFIASELQAAVNKSEITSAAVDEIIRFGHDRKAWLTFCSGVEHAYAVRDEFRRRGIFCEAVDGGLPSAERDRIIASFKAGRIRAITNVSVLTTGFNVPQVDLLAMLRPTQSAGLYLQIAGRGTRNAPGKRDCLVLDFAGNVARHGPVDAVRPKKPGAGGGDAPIKICQHCASIVHASVMVCPDCGHEFPPSEEARHRATADDAPIMASAAPEWVRVAARTFRRHDKAAAMGGLSTTSLRVEYLCGLTTHREWWCPEHEGYARQKFERLWREHGGASPVPATVEDAIQRSGELRPTDEIRIRPSGKYFEIVGRRVAQLQEAA
jgi:DNA repair protein RadD